MQKKAFTLIELLVVIAIIAILAAILFPVFAQAKLAAKKAAGLSQVKQIGTGVQMYLADSDDVLPGYRFSSTTTAINPTYLKFQAAGDPRAATMASQGSNTIKSAFFNQVLDPYVKNDDIWKAPTNSNAWVNFQDKGTWDNGYHSYGGQNSYGLNNYVFSANKGLSSSAIAESANTLIIVDATYYNALPAMPNNGSTFCVLGETNLSGSYLHYWKHLGNNQLNFNNLGSPDPNAASNADVIKNINARYNGVLNVVRADTSSKALNALAIIRNLQVDPAASYWNPFKTPCQ